MNLLLIGLLVLLSGLIVGLVWVWIIGVPKSEKYRRYESASSEATMRNKAWDAAVSRARNRIHGSS